MAKYLLIVESPAKSRTISKYLGKDFIIKASYGHIRDLPAYRLGVNISKNFNPYYAILKDKVKILKELNKIAEKVEKIYIATDPDREGEAIAWHIQQSLEVDPKKVRRIVFHEITKKAVTESIKNSRDINHHLVDAQQARRVLDRLIGYKLSPILSKKIQRGLSAGRVQSVAVKIICEKEKEIQEFKPKEYWNIDAEVSTSKKQNFKTRLFAQKNEKTKLEINNKKEADSILKILKIAEYSVEKIDKKKTSKRPAPPFITSSLQQEASRKFNWTTKKTMYVAQQLYEGIEIEGESIGLITYMRTDSFRIADEAQGAAKAFIKKEYGQNYIPENKQIYTQKKKVQDAHEAIRPSHFERTPKGLKPLLSPDLFKLYKLVWDRFIASQMKSALLENTHILIKAQEKNQDYFFKTTGNVILFDGFIRLYTETKEESHTDQSNEQPSLPALTEKEKLNLEKLDSEQHFTKPPSRYTEASLIKELEDKGIGRPSTYAPTISTIQERHYINREKKILSPSDLGILVNEKLQKFFNNVINTHFTASMENLLDEIIEGKHDWQDVVGEFYVPFSEKLEIANTKMEKIRQDKPTDKICEKCNSPMVIKQGRFGEFLACSNFPECKNTKSLSQNLDVNCPECNHPLVEKRSKKGKVFYGCSNYPKCKFALWDKPIPKKCPKCKNPYMLEKTLKNKKTVTYCPKCADENKKST